MLTAFFLTDEFKENIMTNSLYQALPAQDGNYVANISDPRPGVAWIAGGDQAGQPGYGEFTIYGGNQFIDLSSTPSGGVTTLTIPVGGYTGATLSHKISDALTGAGSPFSDWVCAYGPSSHNPGVPQGKFYIGARVGAFNSEVLRFGDGPNAANSMASTLGFPDENTADALQHVSPEFRYTNHTWVVFDVGAGTKIKTAMCDLDTSDPDHDVDDSSVKIYGSSGFWGSGDQLQNWVANADKTLTFSPAPSTTENQIRVAFDADGASMTYRYWLFSWVHGDELTRHKVRLLKAFVPTMSSTRTITTMKGHGLLAPARALGANNYYPVNQLRRWRVPLAFDAWSASDYRDVIHAAVRHGKQDGMMWMLRWDDVASGAVTAVGDVGYGYIVWCSLHRYSLDTYVGEGDDYISGELMLEQVR